jgi:hypothetical protein
VVIAISLGSGSRNDASKTPNQGNVVVAGHASEEQGFRQAETDSSGPFFDCHFHQSLGYQSPNDFEAEQQASLTA